MEGPHHDENYDDDDGANDDGNKGQKLPRYFMS